METIIRKVPILLETIEQSIDQFTNTSTGNLQLVKDACNNRLKLNRIADERYIPCASPKINSCAPEVLETEFKVLKGMIVTIKRLLGQYLNKAQNEINKFKSLFDHYILEYCLSTTQPQIGSASISDVCAQLDSIMRIYLTEYTLKIDILDYLLANKFLTYQKAQLFVSAWTHSPFIKQCDRSLEKLINSFDSKSI